MPSELSSSAELLASLPASRRKQILRSYSEEKVRGLLYDWRFWARPKQLPPPGNWHIWLICAGRGFGKTRSGAEWVRDQVCGPTPLARGRCRHVALVAETAADARKVMVGDGQSGADDTASGIVHIHPPGFRPTYNPSLKRLTWPNGAIASLYNATEPDELRGPQHDGAWCDELAKWQYCQETWDQLSFGLRVGDNPQVCITTTPRPTQTLRDIIAAPGTITVTGSSYENRANLSATFLDEIVARHEGTRLGRQELHAEILDDVPGALWTRAMIDTAHLKGGGLPDMRRVVVGVDPSGTAGGDSANFVGIVVVGLGVDGLGYVLADRTCQLSPAGWGKRTCDAYDEFAGDVVVAERNFGGAMVDHVIKTADRRVPVKLVTASRGKVVRAEPIAALYEQGRVKHAHAMPELEDQLCLMTTDGFQGEGSPDRVDAVVWALTELMVAGPEPMRVSMFGPKVFD